MCGIAGAVGYIDQRVIDAVDRMNNSQTYRGPDDEGTWSSADNVPNKGAYFAFRRLAIIDVSPGGHQPMIDTDTGNAIVFNGEIYNYKQLRRELELEGVRFRSNSDTEVLLKCYAKWGKEALHRLRGMFGLAIWDATNRYTLLARDRLGIKPLYVSMTKEEGQRRQIIFASELRAILASNLVERKLNPAAVEAYIWNGFTVGPETIVSGIEQLMPGNAAIIREDGEMETFAYWSLPRSQPHKDGVERLDEALRTGIRQHLVSDVPLGVFLSGGIDSSAIAAMAVQETGGDNLRTYNLSFDEVEFDESPHAEAVARSLGTQHTEVRLTQSMFKDQLDDALSSIDQPTFDAINSYFISRAIREAGITVALAGTGGDELFGGYDSFRDIRRAVAASRAAAILPVALTRFAGSAITRIMTGKPGAVGPQTRWGKVNDALLCEGSIVNAYQVSYSLFTRDFAQELYGYAQSSNLRFGLPSERASELDGYVRDEETLHAIANVHLANFIGERLLRDTDAASMAVSLEVRVPLLDHEVVDAVATVDSRERFEPLGRKSLLRRIALGNLDPALFDRPKSGFSLPIEVWCRQALREKLDETFADTELCRSVGLNPEAVLRVWTAFKLGAPGLYWSRIWSLFVLVWWAHAHAVAR